MQEKKACIICHTAAFLDYEGVTDGQFVYAHCENGDLTTALWQEYPGPPDDIDWNLIQFYVDHKWGHTDFSTGKIVVPAKWDFAEPFSEDGFAYVVRSCTVSMPPFGKSYRLMDLHVEGGDCWKIDRTGHYVGERRYYAEWSNGSGCLCI